MERNVSYSNEFYSSLSELAGKTIIGRKAGAL
jgi:hypothetical protein